METYNFEISIYNSVFLKNMVNKRIREENIFCIYTFKNC